MAPPSRLKTELEEDDTSCSESGLNARTVELECEEKRTTLTRPRPVMVTVGVTSASESPSRANTELEDVDIRSEPDDGFKSVKENRSRLENEASCYKAAHLSAL